MRCRVARVPAWIRITSYNVCYTKLLRAGYMASNTPFVLIDRRIETLACDT